MTDELEAIVSGRVQLVMYRDFVQRHARSLGLVGTVENLPDNTVHVVAQGLRKNLEELERRLHAGPFLARVEHVSAAWTVSARRFEKFSIIF
jgi:acylphosphatase